MLELTKTIPEATKFQDDDAQVLAAHRQHLGIVGEDADQRSGIDLAQHVSATINALAISTPTRKVSRTRSAGARRSSGPPPG